MATKIPIFERFSLFNLVSSQILSQLGWIFYKKTFPLSLYRIIFKLDLILKYFIVYTRCTYNFSFCFGTSSTQLNGGFANNFRFHLKFYSTILELDVHNNVLIISDLLPCVTCSKKVWFTTPYSLVYLCVNLCFFKIYIVLITIQNWRNVIMISKQAENVNHLYQFKMIFIDISLLLSNSSNF
jgi:hypothetical protein